MLNSDTNRVHDQEHLSGKDLDRGVVNSRWTELKLSWHPFTKSASSSSIETFTARTGDILIFKLNFVFQIEAWLLLKECHVYIVRIIRTSIFLLDQVFEYMYQTCLVLDYREWESKLICSLVNFYKTKQQKGSTDRQNARAELQSIPDLLVRRPCMQPQN